ncbi:5982_t:CDS:2 [Ambispora leptoticha]|uniref:5982_t:CDS:1 n=1 Tax=Ambispora leptoticha TaxID=144679 RepID=A0A9N9CHW3_9GLOM|nr:5982_t:CDS:2 [Ambispora leptoticha]
MKSAQSLQDNIIKVAKSDMNGQSLIWGAHDISSERSLMMEAEEKQINIKAFFLIQLLLLAKFNDHHTNIIRTNGIPSVSTNNQSILRNGTRKLPDDDETVEHESTTIGLDYQVSDNDNEDKFGEGTSSETYYQTNQNSEEKEDLVTGQRWEKLIQEWK